MSSSNIFTFQYFNIQTPGATAVSPAAAAKLTDAIRVCAGGGQWSQQTAVRHWPVTPQNMTVTMPGSRSQKYNNCRYNFICNLNVAVLGLIQDRDCEEHKDTGPNIDNKIKSLSPKASQPGRTELLCWSGLSKLYDPTSQLQSPGGKWIQETLDIVLPDSTWYNNAALSICPVW